MVAALRALDTALAEPKLTRLELRRRMVEALTAVTDGGPEAVPRSLQAD